MIRSIIKNVGTYTYFTDICIETCCVHVKIATHNCVNHVCLYFFAAAQIMMGERLVGQVSVCKKDVVSDCWKSLASYCVSAMFCRCSLSDPDGIQTHDLQNRNLTLYSAKLRDHNEQIRCTKNGGMPRNGGAKVMQKKKLRKYL